MQPNDVVFNPFGSNVSLINIEQIELPLSIRSNTQGKMKQICELLLHKNITEFDRDIIIKALELCKDKEYKITRLGKFQRITKKIRMTD